MGVFQRHTQRKKPGIGRGEGGREITWLTYIYSPENGRENKQQGKPCELASQRGGGYILD